MHRLSRLAVRRYATSASTQPTKFIITDRLSLQTLLTSTNPSITTALRQIRSTPEQNLQYNSLLRRFLKTPSSQDSVVNFTALRGLKDLLAKCGVELDIEALEEERRNEISSSGSDTSSLEDTPSKDLPNRPYPNLMSPDPLMDSMELLDMPPTKTNPYHNRVIERNIQSFFVESHFKDNPPEWTVFEQDGQKVEGWDLQYPPKGVEPTKTDLNEEEVKEFELANIPESFRPKFIFPILHRFVTQQTGKGKIQQSQGWVVVGNGNGLVGIGAGTDDEPSAAWTKARINALKNLDYIHRFEDRTIWTDMTLKFRSTEIKMRPRPVGFGLRCGPVVHQVLKAGGIKDISAKVWGSRNPVMIMQALMMMLGGGHNPLGFGDGAGGRGKRLGKGYGMRTKWDVERERGRRVEVFRK
ncbi:37s ribosomal protein s5 [Moniliophthora roreri]|uniref:S5 DRBM domain-containing protein n=1 Tax=Moniliophthora roreri TaxID=221103 RepID=A0A0W0G2I6_MONRR|nr:37s ribosomal protein s5 [Moniliophthora roreri]